MGVEASTPRPLITTGHLGPRTPWSVPVYMSLLYLFPNLLYPTTVHLGSRVPESITPAVSQRSTDAGEVPDPSSWTVQTPDDRPGDPAIVFWTPGIAQVIPEHPSSVFVLQTSLLF